VLAEIAAAFGNTASNFSMSSGLIFMMATSRTMLPPDGGKVRKTADEG
jgi:hypothetical protein